MDIIEDKRDLPIFIHSELDDLGLTSKAFRVSFLFLFQVYQDLIEFYLKQ
jgi:hypothetical protein